MKYQLKISDFVLCKNLNNNHLSLVYCGESRFEKLAYLQIEKLIRSVTELDFKHLFDCITDMYEAGRKPIKKDKKVMKQLTKLQSIITQTTKGNVK